MFACEAADGEDILERYLRCPHLWMRLCMAAPPLVAPGERRCGICRAGASMHEAEMFLGRVAAAYHAYRSARFAVPPLSEADLEWFVVAAAFKFEVHRSGRFGEFSQSRDQGSRRSQCVRALNAFRNSDES